MGKNFRESLDDLSKLPDTDAGEAEPPRVGEVGGTHPTVDLLRQRFGDAVLHHEVVAGDEHVVYIRGERSVEILQWLKEDPDCDYSLLVDLTSVDYGGGRPLQVVYQLWSIPNKQALRVKAELPLDALRIETVVPIWSTADWLEREVYDLFGIQFRGHPDLRRILMPDEYTSFPLRKDYPMRGRGERHNFQPITRAES
jgi:NADH-quinone oxidoreductase subunit C